MLRSSRRIKARQSNSVPAALARGAAFMCDDHLTVTFPVWRVPENVAGRTNQTDRSTADRDIPQQQIASEAAPALHFGRRGAHRTGLPERRREMDVKPVGLSRALIV